MKKSLLIFCLLLIGAISLIAQNTETEKQKSEPLENTSRNLTPDDTKNETDKIKELNELISIEKLELAKLGVIQLPNYPNPSNSIALKEYLEKLLELKKETSTKP